MGSGKTSVGQALSRRLSWRFEDLDTRIQTRAGRTIAEMFRDPGEAAFRRSEREALSEVLAEADGAPGVVIALGGGAFVQAEIAALLAKREEPVVFLDAPVEELWRRCQAAPGERPLGRTEQQFRRLNESRRLHYLKARVHINTGGKDVETVAAEIVAVLGLAKEPAKEK